MVGFLKLRRQCGVSHEVQQGAQGASHVAPGKSGVHVHGEGERVARDPVEVAGPLGTQLGLAQRKGASPRGEAGTSGFLCVSDSVSLPLGLALGSPIFPSGCEGKLGVALESLQGLLP